MEDIDETFDGAFDEAFDGAFDEAFDETFDEAFDAGRAVGSVGAGIIGQRKLIWGVSAQSNFWCG